MLSSEFFFCLNCGAPKIDVIDVILVSFGSLGESTACAQKPLKNVQGIGRVRIDAWGRSSGL